MLRKSGAWLIALSVATAVILTGVFCFYCVSDKSCFRADPVEVRVLRFSGDGSRIATVGCDYYIKIWSFPGLRIQKIINGSGVGLITWDVTRGNLIGGMCEPNQAGKLIVWRAGGFKQTASRDEHSKELTYLGLSQDGNKIISASADDKVILWDGSTLTAESVFVERRVIAAFAWDKKLLIINDYGEIKLRHMADQVIEMYPWKGGIETVSMTKDCKWLAVAGGLHANGINLWDLRKKNIIKKICGRASGISCLRFSNSGRLLASGTSNGKAIIWSVPEGNVVSELQYGDWVRSIDFSPDDAFVAVGGAGGMVRIFGLATCQ